MFAALHYWHHHLFLNICINYAITNGYYIHLWKKKWPSDSTNTDTESPVKQCARCRIFSSIKPGGKYIFPRMSQVITMQMYIQLAQSTNYDVVVIRPHRHTTHADVATEMPFAVSRVDLENHILAGGPDPPWKINRIEIEIEKIKKLTQY